MGFKSALYGQNNQITTEQFIRILERMNQTIKFLKTNHWCGQNLY